MKWNKQSSVLLSKVCVVAFALALLALDIGCKWLLDGCMGLLFDTLRQESILMILIYICSIPGWVTLWSLWLLLHRIYEGQVFVPENVRDMRRTSWCCILVGILCAALTPFYWFLAIIAVMAGFVGLIVRIVKNIFEQAMEMKDELDFTV